MQSMIRWSTIISLKPSNQQKIIKMGEKSPLLSNTDGNGYYFLNDVKEGKSRDVQDEDGGAYFQGIPDGSTAEEFEPRKLGPKRQVGKIPFRC